MTHNVAEFIEWWSGLTPAQRQEHIARARERRAYWIRKRADVLFGLLEGDAMFGTFDNPNVHVEVVLTPESDNLPGVAFKDWDGTNHTKK